MSSAAFIVSGIDPEGVAFSVSCNTLSDASIEGQKRWINGCSDMVITAHPWGTRYPEIEYPSLFRPLTEVERSQAERRMREGGIWARPFPLTEGPTGG
jgi:hypothetical protein